MRYFLIIALMGISSVALAGAPNFAGFAGLVDADKDGYPVFVGTSTAASTGYSGVVDCDDKHKGINPGAEEIVNDGIDQDCDKVDLKVNAADNVFKRYVAAEYRGSTPSARRFNYEYDGCKAATSKCEVDDIDGRYRVTDSSSLFVDIYVNGTKVLRNHNEKADGREVVTKTEASSFHGSLTGTGGSGSGSGSSTGVSPATLKKLAEDAAAKAVKAEEEKRLAYQAALETGIIAPITEIVNAHGAAIETNASAIEAEVTARQEADRAEQKRAEQAEKALGREVTDAVTAANEAVTTANAVASHGPLIEGYVVTGVVAGAQITDQGDRVRNGLGAGVGGGINVGADLESGRVNAFVDAIIGGDGGAGPAHSEAVGIEIVGENHFGGFLAYSSRSSQPNALETQVLGRNPLVGVSYALPFAQNGAKHGLFQARVGCGPEFIGMVGDSVTDGVSIGCRATVGIGGGIGALQ